MSVSSARFKSKARWPERGGGLGRDRRQPRLFARQNDIVELTRSLRQMDKSADAFRTISEAAEELHLPQHVLRFWETRFPQIKPLKRAGGRRYYRPRDIQILRAIKHLLYAEGYTIKGVQRLLREQGVEAAATEWGRTAEDRAGLSSRSGCELPHLRASPGCEDASAADGLARPNGLEPSAQPRRAAGEDDPAAKAREGATPPLSLTPEITARLQAALAQLAECEQILLAARRRQD